MCLWANLFIHSIGPHISCSRIGRPIVGIYKSLTDSWMWKFGLWLGNSFSWEYFFSFLVLVLCSAGPCLPMLAILPLPFKTPFWKRTAKEVTVKKISWIKFRKAFCGAKCLLEPVYTGHFYFREQAASFFAVTIPLFYLLFVLCVHYLLFLPFRHFLICVSLPIYNRFPDQFWRMLRTPESIKYNNNIAESVVCF